MNGEDERADIAEECDESFPRDSVSEPGTCAQAPPQKFITVTVRRDYPIRRSEKFGAWGWSGPHGENPAQPMQWSGGAMTPSRDDPIEGWSIGRPSMGAPGRNGGEYTTDRRAPIGAEVRLYCGGAVVTGRTAGADGEVVLETTGLSGAGTVEIFPDDCDDIAEVGPGWDTSQIVTNLIYRSLTIVIELADGELIEIVDPYDPPSAQTHGRIGNHAMHAPTSTDLPVTLKPIWWRHPNPRPRRGNADVRTFVIHCTSGTRLGPTLNRFLGGTGPVGAHYMMEIDGHLMKQVDDTSAINHVGRVDDWERHRDGGYNNDHAIGIEIINPNGFHSGENADAYMSGTRAAPYTNEQYISVIALAHAVIARFPRVAHRIIGHNDVSVGPAGSRPAHRLQLNRRKQWDPGERFEWERLEAENLGMVLKEEYSHAEAYSGIFEMWPDLVLLDGDREMRDGRARLGGERRDDVGTPISDIQSDLRNIGYSIPRVSGRMDRWTLGAVDRFKRHFFSGSRWSEGRGRVRNGLASDIDKRCAMAIRWIALRFEVSDETTEIPDPASAHTGTH